jgi:glycosyltransferase 2 family protein
MSSIDAGSAPLTRSPADVLRLIVALVVLVVFLIVEWLFGDTLVAFGSDLLRGLDAVPTWIVNIIVIGSRMLAAVILIGGFFWTVAHGRWTMLTRVVLAAAIAVVLAYLRDRVHDSDTGATVVDVTVGVWPFSESGFPTIAGVAGTAAVLTAAAPWLSRGWRRAGWALVLGLMITRTLTAPVSFDAVAGFIIGWLSGAIVLVALGAPSRRPTKAAVMAGLDAVGLPMSSLEAASVDARGSTPYFGIAADGSSLFVKALGDDERSADLLFRSYRRLQPRDFGDERQFSSLRRTVEHEALVALAARDLGVRTPRLRALASATPNGYVLAYDAIAGRSLDRLEPAEVTDEVLAAIWRLVAVLQAHRIAHRDLRLANIFRDDQGEMWLIDFGFSELAASDLLLATDVAELMASSSLYVGAARAVDHAASTVDAATLERAAARLHPWALAGATRTAHKARPGLLDELRSRLAAV